MIGKVWVAMSKLHTIGEVASTCGVSRKTLRFYEELGLLAPDYVCPSNGYRYYSEDTMHMIPILKYYKQMGFRLNEMSGVGDTANYFYHQQNFLSKLTELKKEEERIQNCYQSVSDWLNLLNEGVMATENDISDISLKYIEQDYYYFMEQPFEYDYKKSIINITWINYLEQHNSEITGPVVLYFDDYQEKAAGKCQQVIVTQKPCKNNQHTLPLKDFGGQMYLCMYHRGNPGESSEKYVHMEAWAKEHDYTLGPGCYERFVIDYWSLKNQEKFVTEIMIPVAK